MSKTNQPYLFVTDKLTLTWLWQRNVFSSRSSGWGGGCEKHEIYAAISFMTYFYRVTGPGGGHGPPESATGFTRLWILHFFLVQKPMAAFTQPMTTPNQPDWYQKGNIKLEFHPPPIPQQIKWSSVRKTDHKRLLKKIFGRKKSFSWSHWYLYFGAQLTSALGFKARMAFWLACFVACTTDS